MVMFAAICKGEFGFGEEFLFCADVFSSCGTRWPLITWLTKMLQILQLKQERALSVKSDWTGYQSWVTFCAGGNWMAGIRQYGLARFHSRPPCLTETQSFPSRLAIFRSFGPHTPFLFAFSLWHPPSISRLPLKLRACPVSMTTRPFH